MIQFKVPGVSPKPGSRPGRRIAASGGAAARNPRLRSPGLRAGAAAPLRNGGDDAGNPSLPPAGFRTDAGAALPVGRAATTQPGTGHPVD